MINEDSEPDSPIFNPIFFSDLNPCFNTEDRSLYLKDDDQTSDLPSNLSFHKEILPYDSKRRTKRFLRDFNHLKGFPNIVIDCSLESYQSDKEIFKMAQQILFSYGHICSDLKPLHLSIVGLGSRLQAELNRIQGWKQWLCTFEIDLWEKLYPHDQVIYLSADSEDVLESFDESKIYIIGGIIDRNRCKGLTKNIADRLGVLCKRLPIKEYINLKTSPVLTVNQTVDILVNLHRNPDWKTVLEKVLPKRKIKK